MKLSVIVAVSSNNVIGYKNRLPWHLPADLKYFKKITMGHPVIMGRKSYEAIGRPLPGRTNIIITRRLNYEIPGCVVVNSMEEAIRLCAGEEEIFVIGGAEVIGQVINNVDRIYLTKVHHEFEGDTFLPSWHEGEWDEIQREDFNPDDKNAFGYTFLIFEKKTI